MQGLILYIQENERQKSEKSEHRSLLKTQSTQLQEMQNELNSAKNTIKILKQVLLSLYATFD